VLLIATGIITAGLGVLFGMTGRNQSPTFPALLLVSGIVVALVGLASL
jgi:hypothetical membrane protein